MSPSEAPRTGDDPDLSAFTPGELELLEALASGLKDSVAEQRLGLSRRTLRRRLQEAMGKLGASSRFQAGYRFALVQGQKEQGHA